MAYVDNGHFIYILNNDVNINTMNHFVLSR